MRSVVLTASMVALMAASLPAQADCTRTYNQPKIPKGLNASEDEMHDARAAVQAYVDQLQSYQVCLEQQIASAPELVTIETKNKWRSWGNDAVTDAERAATEFSMQLKAYRDRSKPPPPKSKKSPFQSE